MIVDEILFFATILRIDFEGCSNVLLIGEDLVKAGLILCMDQLCYKWWSWKAGWAKPQCVPCNWYHFFFFRDPWLCLWTKACKALQWREEIAHHEPRFSIDSLKTFACSKERQVDRNNRLAWQATESWSESCSSCLPSVLPFSQTPCWIWCLASCSEHFLRSQSTRCSSRRQNWWNQCKGGSVRSCLTH